MKKYEVTGVVEYAACVSCEVEANNLKEAKEKAREIFDQRALGLFPEPVNIVVDKPTIQTNQP